jgi:hypothetical protein
MTIVSLGFATTAYAAVDTTKPTIDINTPFDGMSLRQGDPAFVNFVCTDELDGSGIASCTAVQQDGIVLAYGDPLDTSTIGDKSLTVTAIDGAGNVAVRTHHFSVISNGSWPFGGFRPPVDPQPTVNVSKSGSVVPVQFSLGGNRGPDIFVGGLPRSVATSCVSGLENDVLEATASPGSSVLTYDAGKDVYHYNWQTSKSWKDTCRTLVLERADGTTHRASFRFV